MNLTEDEVKKQIKIIEEELKKNQLTLSLLNYYLGELRSKKKFIKTGSNKIDWKKIILKIFAEHNQLLSTYEIYDFALKAHPELSEEPKQKLIRQISNCLTHLCDKKRRCGRFTVPGEKGNFWGLNEFFTKVESHPYEVPLKELNHYLIKKGYKTGINDRDYEPVEISNEADDIERRGE